MSRSGFGELVSCMGLNCKSKEIVGTAQTWGIICKESQIFDKVHHCMCVVLDEICSFPTSLLAVDKKNYFVEFFLKLECFLEKLKYLKFDNVLL